MPAAPSVEPSRPPDVARLGLTRLRIEDGVSLDAVFRQATETAAVVLGVERAGVWLYIDDRHALRCYDLFEQSKGLHSSGTTLQVSEFPEYFDALDRRKTIPAENAVADPLTTGLTDAYLVPLGITSLLDAPIYIGGRVVGVLCHEHTGPAREWTTEQRDFAGSMADLLALKIRAAEMQELKAAVQTQSAQLADVARASGINDTAAGVAHDFKNILTVMIGNADRILHDASNSDRTLDFARRILQAGSQGVELADQMLQLARPGPQSSRVIRPDAVVSKQLDVLRTAAGERHAVSLDLKTRTGRVLIDPNQLERVLLNLVVNARDAMPAGGPIHIGVEAVDAADESGTTGRYVLIAVSDRGEGIPADVLGHIFEPFFTTKPRGKGTGVGLAVVQQVVTYAGGFVAVESAVGQGTTFRIYLPQVSSG